MDGNCFLKLPKMGVKTKEELLVMLSEQIFYTITLYNGVLSQNKRKT